MGEILLCLYAVIQAGIADADWPQFRGPTGDGLAAGATPPVRWSDTENIRWKVKGQIPLMSSPILVGKEIYLVSDAGIASCLDALTGELNWRERLGGRYLASPVCAANRLYFVNDEAQTSVLAVGTSFQRLAENVLSGTVVATPAVVGRAIYLRTDSHLYRIEAASAAE